MFKNNEKLLPILIRLIQEPWHQMHEDIASTLQWDIPSPKAIEVLYKTALTKFDYLDFDEAYALAVKCIWALGDINTPESMEKLELLAESKNKIIRKNAKAQLKRHPDTVKKLHENRYKSKQ